MSKSHAARAPPIMMPATDPTIGKRCTSCPIYGYTSKPRTGLDSITMVVSTPSGEQQHSVRFR